MGEGLTQRDLMERMFNGIENMLVQLSSQGEALLSIGRELKDLKEAQRKTEERYDRIYETLRARAESQSGRIDRIESRVEGIDNSINTELIEKLKRISGIFDKRDVNDLLASEELSAVRSVIRSESEINNSIQQAKINARNIDAIDVRISDNITSTTKRIDAQRADINNLKELLTPELVNHLLQSVKDQKIYDTENIKGHIYLRNGLFIASISIFGGGLVTIISKLLGLG